MLLIVVKWAHSGLNHWPLFLYIVSDRYCRVAAASMLHDTGFRLVINTYYNYLISITELGDF
jgi:hypothetical protein